MLALICEAHGYARGQIQLQALYALKQQMATHIAQGSTMPGLKQSRRDLLLPGWCVLVGLMETVGIATINFSATALREGMLDFMVKNEKTLQALQQSDLPDVNFAKA